MKRFIYLWFKYLFIVLAGVFVVCVFVGGWALIDNLIVFESLWYPIVGLSWTVLWVVTGITILRYKTKR